MPERTTTGVPVIAVRYDVSRWTVAQALVPFAMLAGVAARRVPSIITIGAAAALLCATVVAFARARRNLGAQSLLDEGSSLRLQASGEELSRKTIGRWTSRAGIVRLHGSRHSYKLKVEESQRKDLEILFTRALGAVTPTTRRGSPRARALAAGAFVAGLVVLGVAIGTQSVPLLFVGVPAVIIGAATFGALSQRVIR